jgi:hypothetical protein
LILLGLAIESPTFKPPKDQDNPTEESELGGHGNPIEEPKNSISSEESMWGEIF